MGQGFISKYILRDIAGFIRKRKGTTAEIKPVDMVAELESIPTFEDGIEQGKQAESALIWGVYQNYGEETLYQTAFAYGRFNDQTYSPPYAIAVAKSTTGLDQCFYRCGLTDVKVPIYASKVGRLSQTFELSDTLERVPFLQISENCTFYRPFHGCNNLKHLIMGGTIGKNDFDVSMCPYLDKESLTSIVGCLSTTTSGLSITLPEEAVKREFTDEEWAELVASKPNWTIALV